jgi:hypothetical protein
MILKGLIFAAAVTLPPMPPDAPGPDETVISGVNDPVAANCANSEGVMSKRLKTTQLNVVITNSPKWGTIWRQDVSFPVQRQGDLPILFRSVCWKDGSVERPLEMFDPKASIGPLK